MNFFNLLEVRGRGGEQFYFHAATYVYFDESREAVKIF